MENGMMGKPIRCWNCKTATQWRRGDVVTPVEQRLRWLKSTMIFTQVFEAHLANAKQQPKLVELCDGCELALTKLHKFYSKFMKLTQPYSRIHKLLGKSTYWDYDYSNEDCKIIPNEEAGSTIEVVDLDPDPDPPKRKTPNNVQRKTKDGKEKTPNGTEADTPRRVVKQGNRKRRRGKGGAVSSPANDVSLDGVRIKQEKISTEEARTRNQLNPGQQPPIQNVTVTSSNSANREGGTAQGNRGSRNNAQNPRNRGQEQTVTTRNGSRKLRCHIADCKSTFKTLGSRVFHERIQHPGYISDHNKMMQCTYCGKVYNRSRWKGFHLPRCELNPFRTNDNLTPGNCNEAPPNSAKLDKLRNRGYRFN